MSISGSLLEEGLPTEGKEPCISGGEEGLGASLSHDQSGDPSCRGGDSRPGEDSSSPGGSSSGLAGSSSRPAGMGPVLISHGERDDVVLRQVVLRSGWGRRGKVCRGQGGEAERVQRVGPGGRGRGAGGRGEAWGPGMGGRDLGAGDRGQVRGGTGGGGTGGGGQGPTVCDL